MKIIETYGNYIEKWSNEDPDRARWLLKTGWKAQNLKFRFARTKTDAGRPVSCQTYDGYDAYAFGKPQESAIVSIFTPCELLQEAGIHPYNVEGFSCYTFCIKGRKSNFYSRQKIQEFLRHFAVIIRHLSGRHRRKCFRNQSALCTRT